MLNDLNTENTMLEPTQSVIKRMRAQIDYLDHNKANCVDICACNRDGFVTFSVDCDGNETIKGKRNFATPICGFTNVEDSLTCLLTDGGGGLATKVMQYGCNEGTLLLGNGCVDEYTNINVNNCLHYNNDTLYAPNINTIGAVIENISTTDGLTIDSNVTIKNGIVQTGCSAMDCDGNATFTCSVTTNDIYSANVSNVTNIKAATDNLCFFDGNSNPLGKIDGDTVCFNNACFTNATVTNLSATNFDIPYMRYDSDNNILRVGQINCVTSGENNVMIGYNFGYECSDACCFKNNFIANATICCGCPSRFNNSVLVNSNVFSPYNSEVKGVFIGNNYCQTYFYNGNIENIYACKLGGVGNLSNWYYKSDDYTNACLYEAIVNTTSITTGGMQDSPKDYPVLGYIYYDNCNTGDFWYHDGVCKVSHCFGASDSALRIYTTTGHVLTISRCDTTVPVQNVRIRLQLLILDREY